MTRKETLDLYGKAVLDQADRKMIMGAIDRGLIDADEIMEEFIDYVCKRIEADQVPLTIMEVWNWTAYNYQNLLSHAENYNELINLLYKPTIKQ